MVLYHSERLLAAGKQRGTNTLQEHDQINALISWINSFDSSHLKNEDDVETKFVLPLFRKLNYPDECRHGKYPIDDYKSEKGKIGRKNEIDQIYFSVSDPENQNEDTSLIIVEAKNPQVPNLEDASKQAIYYGNHMYIVFLVITNGHRLKILKRHDYRAEIVFDIHVNELRDKSTASRIYNQLQFERVKHLKEHGTDPLAHALSIIDYHEEKDIPLSNVSKPKQLAEYLHEIQSYLLHYGAENVPALHLRPYYTALTKIARTVDPEITQLNYLQEKLGAVQLRLKKRQGTSRHQDLTTYSNILKYLEQQVKRIYEVDYEYHIISELISRSFIDIIETKISVFQQEQLNAAKKALQPLWEDYRFHYHFIEPINLPL